MQPSNQEGLISPYIPGLKRRGFAAQLVIARGNLLGGFLSDGHSRHDLSLFCGYQGVKHFARKTTTPALGEGCR
jgi:hypothetical protein